MNRDKHSKRHSNSNWKNNNNSNTNNRQNDNNKNYSSKKNSNAMKNVSNEQIAATEAAIRAFKSNNQPLCAHCKQPIIDMATAITDRNKGGTIHFDCALEQLSETEKLEAGDKLTYIGQGRFGIVNFANPHDMKHFTIKKVIDWEDKEKKADWRNEMADLYSQVK